MLDQDDHGARRRADDAAAFVTSTTGRTRVGEAALRRLELQVPVPFGVSRHGRRSPARGPAPATPPAASDPAAARPPDPMLERPEQGLHRGASTR